jgi:glycosyltransferase involved in cell wall biosynthesis
MTVIYWINLNRFDVNVSKAPRLEMSDHLYRENLHVVLLTGYKKKKYFSKIFKIQIKYFKTINLPGFFKASLNISIFFWLLKNINYNDIIIVPPASLFIGIMLKTIKKCRLHLDIRTLPVEIFTFINRVEYYLFWYFPLKALSEKSDSFSFITENLKENIQKKLKINFKDYIIWHSGVNKKHFSIAKKKLNFKNRRYIITYLGVVTKSRGIDIILNALAKLRDSYKEQISFQIIGDGPYFKEIEKLVFDLKLQNYVNLKGYVEYEYIPEQLKDTDCFICPLPKLTEWSVSSPIKVFEYLACAKPIILTPIEAHLNIVSKENEFIVWTNGYNVQHFIESFEYVIDNKLLLAEAAKKSDLYIKKSYEWKVQGKNFASYLKKKHVIK